METGENKATRYEIVLLDDDPETLALLEDELSCRGIKVHACARGEAALQKILDDPNIGALLTDIEIRETYPDGLLSDLQGYNVANRILTDAPNRLLSVVVMTQLTAKVAFRNLRLFQVPVTEFHKDEWIGAGDEAIREQAFDDLADLIKEAIERTPHRYYEELKSENPVRRWIRHDDWSLYRSLWFSPTWPVTEAEIGERAAGIVEAYLEGETRKLRGELLSFSKQPDGGQLLNHLVARRVVYALKRLQPAYWESLILGEYVEEEKTAIGPEVWQDIESENVRSLFNQLQDYIYRNDLANRHEAYDQLSRAERQAYREAKEAAQAEVKKLAQALEKEPEGVQEGFVPYLRFWNLDFTEVDWTVGSGSSTKGQQNLKQTLYLIGLRREDIKGRNPNNWKLLLPEERVWLKRIVEQYTEDSN